MKHLLFTGFAAALLMTASPALALTQAQFDCPSQATGSKGAEVFAAAMLANDEGHAAALAEGTKLTAVVKACMAQLKIPEAQSDGYFDYALHRISHDGFSSLLGTTGFPVAVIDKTFDFGPGRANPVMKDLNDAQIGKLIEELGKAGFKIEGVPQSTWQLVGAYIVATSTMYEKRAALD